MILEEIVHTCSNVDVANAAVASIGGSFAESFATKASRSNLSTGMLAALVVKDFSANASFDQMADVYRAARDRQYRDKSTCSEKLAASPTSMLPFCSRSGIMPCMTYDRAILLECARGLLALGESARV